MPRTTTVECPGCPPIRVLTFDVLGLVKVVEARAKQGGVPKVVERWGEPDTSRHVLAASINDSKFDPLLAVARKSGVTEVLNPINGDLRGLVPSVCQSDVQPEDDAIVGLHLFKKQISDSSSSSGNIVCSKVDGSENYALFGGKGVEANVWDLDKCTKIWTAKSPPKNSLGIFTPTWFTSATFISKDDHRKFVTGTNNHQVRLYDISAQRRPVMSFDFRETTIKAVAEDLDGQTVYIGNGSGDLASVDMRTGIQYCQHVLT
ncbi:unnamed protein product [Ilex paraguariensis]|uniref:WD repeat-containing protein 74 n=1 Tax=Ilex paraguariensis TaxID=185542 RepID=A0ABC8RBI4_9AQUA